MRIASTFSVPASPERVWILWLDPEALLASVPGGEAIKPVSDTVSRAGLEVKRSCITLSLGGELSQRLAPGLESSRAGS